MPIHQIENSIASAAVATMANGAPCQKPSSQTPRKGPTAQPVPA
jgi:hypothetical protein